MQQVDLRSTGISPKELPVWQYLNDLYTRHRPNLSGELASYIPELSAVDPDRFSLAFATTDGFVYEVGDTDALFTIQSVSKAVIYALALEDHGREEVLRHIGVEPSGEAFNSITFDERNNRPFNPMVNAGAIAASAMIKGTDHAERYQRILDIFQRFTGRILDLDEAVYRSETVTGNRNRAIAYLELNAGMISGDVNEHLDLYFRQCSLLVRARDLAMIGATLANGGVNPVTRQRAISTDTGEGARVEREEAWQAQHRIGEQQRRKVEQQHMNGIAPPSLLLGRVDPGEPIEAALHRAEHPVQRGRAALVEREKPKTHRLGQREGDGDEGQDQCPACNGHGLGFRLETLGPQKRDDEVDQQAGGNDAGDE